MAAIYAMLEGFFPATSDLHVNVHRQLADGNTVSNERTDHITMGELARPKLVAGSSVSTTFA